jgi:uncharacterized membrane protein YgcG
MSQSNPQAEGIGTIITNLLSSKSKTKVRVRFTIEDLVTETESTICFDATDVVIGQVDDTIVTHILGGDNDNGDEEINVECVDRLPEPLLDNVQDEADSIQLPDEGDYELSPDDVPDEVNTLFRQSRLLCTLEWRPGKRHTATIAASIDPSPGRCAVFEVVSDVFYNDKVLPKRGSDAIPVQVFRKNYIKDQAMLQLPRGSDGSSGDDRGGGRGSGGGSSGGGGGGGGRLTQQVVKRQKLLQSAVTILEERYWRVYLIYYLTHQESDLDVDDDRMQEDVTLKDLSAFGKELPFIEQNNKQWETLVESAQIVKNSAGNYAFLDATVEAFDAFRDRLNDGFATLQNLINNAQLEDKTPVWLKEQILQTALNIEKKTKEIYSGSGGGSSGGGGGGSSGGGGGGSSSGGRRLRQQSVKRQKLLQSGVTILEERYWRGYLIYYLTHQERGLDVADDRMEEDVTFVDLSLRLKELNLSAFGKELPFIKQNNKQWETLVKSAQIDKNSAGNYAFLDSTVESFDAFRNRLKVGFAALQNIINRAQLKDKTPAWLEQQILQIALNIENKTKEILMTHLEMLIPQERLDPTPTQLEKRHWSIYLTDFLTNARNSRLNFDLVRRFVRKNNKEWIELTTDGSIEDREDRRYILVPEDVVTIDEFQIRLQEEIKNLELWMEDNKDQLEEDSLKEKITRSVNEIVKDYKQKLDEYDKKNRMVERSNEEAQLLRNEAENERMKRQKLASINARFNLRLKRV